jgi:hypothetical protein
VGSSPVTAKVTGRLAQMHLRLRLLETSVTFLLLLMASACGQSGSPGAGPGPSSPASPRPSSSPSPKLGPPVRIQIPSIKVDATIEAKGLDDQGRVAVPDKPEEVVWYNGSPPPGQYGNTVLAGHYNWYPCHGGTCAPETFYYLSTLHQGDQVIVTRKDGGRATFVVDWVRTYRYDDHPPGVFASDGPPSLALITCDADGGFVSAQGGTYVLRTVVMAYPPPPKGDDAPPIAG